MRILPLISILWVLPMAAFGQAVQVPIADDAKLKAAFTGNTVTGTDSDGVYFEYFTPDGKIAGQDSSGKYEGAWRVEGGRVCLRYDRDGQQQPAAGGSWDCSSISINRGKITWSGGGERSVSFLLKGNPKGVTSTTASGQAAQAPIADDVKLKAAFAGNTVTGTDSDGVYFEYFRPDGKITGQDASGKYEGAWRVEGGLVCLIYDRDGQLQPAASSSWDCSSVSINGGKITWSGGGDRSVSFLLKGNPKGVSSTTGSGQAAQEAINDRLRAALVGNTVTGRDSDGVYFEYYRPNGTISGREGSDRYDGAWRIEDGQMCVFYSDHWQPVFEDDTSQKAMDDAEAAAKAGGTTSDPNDINDLNNWDCYKISINSDEVTLTGIGEPIISSLLKGNPQGL